LCWNNGEKGDNEEEREEMESTKKKKVEEAKTFKPPPNANPDWTLPFSLSLITHGVVLPCSTEEIKKYLVLLIKGCNVLLSILQLFWVQQVRLCGV
jgi:hypothetical protein